MLKLSLLFYCWFSLSVVVASIPVAANPVVERYKAEEREKREKLEKCLDVFRKAEYQSIKDSNTRYFVKGKEFFMVGIGDDDYCGVDSGRSWILDRIRSLGHPQWKQTYVLEGDEVVEYVEKSWFGEEPQRTRLVVATRRSWLDRLLNR